ncbi:MAG: hypothetical protein H7Z76_08690 [Methylotenera sp.]|nr:hypothetical protein [Flavobacterium sp.]
MKKTKFYLLACFTFLVSSCTITTTKSKDPVFNDMSKVQNELTSLVKAENINLNGKEITKNKKATSELEVSITNGQNIPTSDDQRKVLGKSIASAVKNNLKDANQFDTYQILFITKTENGGVTKRNWVGNVFNSTEL